MLVLIFTFSFNDCISYLFINSPKNVEQIYSDIWFPDRLDSLKWDNSLFSIRLNLKKKTTIPKLSKQFEKKILESQQRTFNDAISETLRCVWMVSNWSRHHSSSSMVSPAKRRYCSSPGSIGFTSGVAAARFDLKTNLICFIFFYGLGVCWWLTWSLRHLWDSKNYFWLAASLPESVRMVSQLNPHRHDWKMENYVIRFYV